MSHALDRRSFLATGLAAGAATLMARHPAQGAPPATAFSPEEATLDELRMGLEAGRWSSQDLVAKYLARIGSFDSAGAALHAVIELNPDAMALAVALDQERQKAGPRGPLHGIPVLVKDNLDTADRMKTTAGSLALVDAPAPSRDAFVVQKLREAGALILGKTNLSEWANLRSTRSTSGWSGRGGQTRNPYALNRNPSGSSSGSAVAVAASLCAAAIGTETDGSIVSPANANGIVGLKPTVGLVSRTGIIPISHSQDTAGPMARTVRDAAILLTAIAGSDPRDRATEEATRQLSRDYTLALDPKGLQGARLGVIKNLLGQHAHVDAALRPALDALKAGGATVVEVELKSSAYDDAEFEVLLFEFKAGLNAYLGARGGAVKDLAALIAFNDKHAVQELAYFGQELLIQAQAKGPLTDAHYLKALDTCRQARLNIHSLCDTHKLDALVAPTGSPAWLTDPINGDAFGFSCSSFAAVAGTPHITVPAGFVFGLPVGLSFFGRAWSETTLLKLAYAFEQRTKARRPPRFSPAAALEA
ncbi:MAG: amidase [Holophaga sp.]|nr:amidase [Holophaga sp.]